MPDITTWNQTLLKGLVISAPSQWNDLALVYPPRKTPHNFLVLPNKMVSLHGHI
jgi:hypothetical protein